MGASSRAVVVVCELQIPHITDKPHSSLGKSFDRPVIRPASSSQLFRLQCSGAAVAAVVPEPETAGPNGRIFRAVV